MPLATPEAREQQIARVDQEMHVELDRYEQMAKTTRKRRPLQVDDYRWKDARPDLVHPTVKASLEFVSHVEFPPRLYAQPTLEAADKEGLTSMRRLIESIWLPEEIQHGEVTRKAAIVYEVVGEEEHDRTLANIAQSDFHIGRGYNAGKASSFIWVQELVTTEYYVAMMHNTEDPVLRRVLGDLASQEMFHHRVAGQFMRAVATAEDVVQTICEFKMPGHVTSPELQQRSTGWAHELGFDFNRMRRVLGNGIVELAGYQGLGRVITSELLRNQAPQPWRAVLSVADRIHNPLLNYLEGRVAARVAGIKAEAV